MANRDLAERFPIYVPDAGGYLRSTADADAEWPVEPEYDPWPGGFEPQPWVSAPLPVRLSASAAVGAIVSVVACCAAVTGLLAFAAIPLGIVGFLLSVAGFRAAGRLAMAGRGLAAFGAVCGLVAVGAAVLAMTGTYPWLNSTGDSLNRWHEWVVARWPWLGRWS